MHIGKIIVLSNAQTKSTLLLIIIHSRQQKHHQKKISEDTKQILPSTVNKQPQIQLF